MGHAEGGLGGGVRRGVSSLKPEGGAPPAARVAKHPQDRPSGRLRIPWHILAQGSWPHAPALRSVYVSLCVCVS
jgi:hypothetical protein